MSQLEKNELVPTPLQKNIVKILQENGPLTRQSMVNELNRARTTIYDSLVKLMSRNVVTRFTRKENQKRGRPKVYFKLVTGN